MKITKYNILIIALLSLLNLISCTSFEPFHVSKATLGPKTATNIELTTLPEPKEKIVAAVYKFRDQTGQYKMTAGSSSFSTAVTQGATSILIKALEDSKWFVPIEREGLSDLLNERKIVRSSRDNFLGDDGKKLPDLPPLLYAGVLLEGGVISYDSNILTGGEGVQYFGISASGQYRQDRMTIYLRAISTQNGRILKTVYTTKTLLSQMIDIGVYKYVDYNTLLQAEAGISYNEPTDICVTQAIEKAVQSLIIEGITEGLWQPKNSDAISSKVIQDYFTEKNVSESKDYLGRTLSAKRGKIGVNMNLSGQLYSGDYSNHEINPALGFNIKYNTANQLFLELSYCRGNLSARNSFSTFFNSLDLRINYYLFNDFIITPYIIFGGGIVIREDNNKSKAYPVKLGSSSFSSLVYGAGLEYLIFNNIGLNIEFTNHNILSDKLDGLTNGKLYDYFWNMNAGLNFYFGY